MQRAPNLPPEPVSRNATESSEGPNYVIAKPLGDPPPQQKKKEP